MILVGQYDSPYVRRVAVTLHHYGIPFTRNPISVFSDATDMARINPLVRIPSLILDDGEVVIDSSAIIDYLDEVAGPPKALTPRWGAERRHVMQLIAVACGATDKIGALGHSLGGATVLVATYHGTIRDPRIDATIALSPLACVFLDDFFDASNVPLLIEHGTVDMITQYTSNGLTPYGYVNAPKYLLTYDGGTHLGFNDRLLWGQNENGDDAVGCSIFVQPGDPRPVTFEANLPPDYLGGAALGIDPSGSMCEPVCPLPPPSFMLQARQNFLTKAATTAFFEEKLRDSVSGRRMITGRLDSEAADATLVFEE